VSSPLLSLRSLRRLITPSPSPSGSSTGFGRHLVENILADGNIAVATLRKPSAIDDLKAQFGEDRLLVLPLDVTKPSDITNAFARVKEVYGRCDAVISNAGFSGMFEKCSGASS
jgi:NAD(P)-dependent dehydrogenase (short-subunit alcohol dehydrogenase family)